jgi:hypothetical protein
VQADDDLTIVAHLEHVGIAAAEFREQPAFPELIAGLVGIWSSKDGAKRRVSGLGPNVVLVLLDQLDAQLGDVARDQRLAGEVSVKARRRVGVDRDVALPGAGERLADDREPAAAAFRYRAQGFLLLRISR